MPDKKGVVTGNYYELAEHLYSLGCSVLPLADKKTPVAYTTTKYGIPNPADGNRESNKATGVIRRTGQLKISTMQPANRTMIRRHHGRRCMQPSVWGYED